MPDKSRKALMALVGAYLIYSGATLIKDVLLGEPKNKTILITFGVIFAVFGLFTVVMNLRDIIKEIKREQQNTDGEDVIADEAVSEVAEESFAEKTEPALDKDAEPVDDEEEKEEEIKEEIKIEEKKETEKEIKEDDGKKEEKIEVKEDEGEKEIEEKEEEE